MFKITMELEPRPQGKGEVIKVGLKLKVEPPIKELVGRDLVAQVIDPEIRAFEEFFNKELNDGKGALNKMEFEVFRAYLYNKILGKF